MTYSVKDVQKLFGVGEGTVLQWIRNGEMRALDVSRQRGGRPHWRVTEESIEAFELARESSPPPVVGRQRKQRSDRVVEFYK